MNIDDLLDRWTAWMERHVPEALETLKPGATDAELNAYEAAIGAKLPEDVRAYFRRWNGQPEWPKERVLLGYEMLGLDDSVCVWKSWHEFEYSNEDWSKFAQQHPTLSSSNPTHAIRYAYTLRGWIPLAQATSNYIGIDLNPGPKGTLGQAINFGRDEEHKFVLGASWTDFLEFLVEQLELQSDLQSQTEVHPYLKASFVDDYPSIIEKLRRLYSQGQFDGRRLHMIHPFEELPPLTWERAEILKDLHQSIIERRADRLREIVQQDHDLLRYPNAWGTSCRTFAEWTREREMPELLEQLAREHSA